MIASRHLHRRVFLAHGQARQQTFGAQSNLASVSLALRSGRASHRRLQRGYDLRNAGARRPGRA
jgi:hypothetical protein